MEKIKLPVISGKKVLKALSKIGILPVRQKGSHVQVKGIYKEQMRYTTVAVHAKEPIPRRTLKGIIEDCGLTIEEFVELLEK